jgi:hypothetical protein
VVDGAAGQRLAAVQAQAILDVLTWCREHAREPSNPAVVTGADA